MKRGSHYVPCQKRPTTTYSLVHNPLSLTVAPVGKGGARPLPPKYYTTILQGREVKYFSLLII
jgi:hypothetical protein